MTDIPRDYDACPTNASRLDRATRRLEADLKKDGVPTVGCPPRKDVKPTPVSLSGAVSAIRAYADDNVPADWAAHPRDPEPWFSLGQWFAAQPWAEDSSGDLFVVDLTPCELDQECGPNAGGHMISGDVEMIVSLVLYAAPHTTDGRALALYQIEVL